MIREGPCWCKMTRKYQRGLSDFLRTYAPDFCWCSAFDLMIMMEQVPELEDVEEGSLGGVLSYLEKQGWFITKPGTRRDVHYEKGVIGRLYLRVEPGAT